jgi:type I restriction enzyme, S subunit
MSRSRETAAPTRRKIVAQGNERTDAAVGKESSNTSSREGANVGGEYPLGWRRAQLGEILPLKYGKARSEQFGYLRPGTQMFGSNGAFGTFNRALTTNSTLIIGRMGAAGAVHYSPEPCWPIDTAFYAEGSKGAFLLFFRYLLESLQLVRLDRSTAIPSLSRDDYSARVVHFPEGLPEQQRIVAEIEKQFTRLEAGVAALRRVQANLKRYRAAVLKAACEGHLVPTEAELAKAGKADPNFETGEALLARILIERRQNWQGRGKYKDPEVHAAAGLATLPEGWIWTTIGSCFHVAVGATPSRKETSYWGGHIPWVSSGEVRFNGIFDTRERITQVGLESSSTQINPRGSVLLGMIGEGRTRGQTAILKIDACNNQNCASIWVSRTTVPLEYVYYWLWSQYENTRRTSSGNNQPALNKARIEAMLLPFPPLTEQTRIVAEVERRLSVVEELEAVVSANLQRATCLRQSILHKAFSGNL